MTNEEFNEQFRRRTRDFAARTVSFSETLPNQTGAKVMAYQLCKAATSVGANFRAFCRGRSKNEKYAKICIVVEEADESEYWLDLFSAVGYGDPQVRAWLSNEALEILKVVAKIKSSLSS